MEIDNFEIFRKHLDFKEKTDRYIIHIMRRPKDDAQLSGVLGSNESQRLLRTYYVDSLEYFDRKIPAIKELCTTTRARAYILPQVRNNFECLLNLGENILCTIRNRNYSVKPEHLLRSSYCECHMSRDKQWVIDLDRDEMVETWVQVNYGGKVLCKREWTLEKVVELVRSELRKTEERKNDKKHSKTTECENNEVSENNNDENAVGKKNTKLEDRVYTIRTKNGWHVITPPFNLEEAQKTCGLLYEGRKKQVVDLEEYCLKKGDKGYTGSIGLDTKYKTIEKEVTGWLHKDGSSLLYMNLD